MSIFIDKDTYVGNTGKQLKDIKTNADNLIFDNNVFEENGLKYSRIGKYNDNYDLYLVQGNLGYMPNSQIKKYTWQISSRFISWHLLSFLAYRGSEKVILPYVYPAVQYIDYWMTIETIGNEEVTIITGTDRSSWILWLSGICLLSKN